LKFWRCHIGLNRRHDALNRALSHPFGATGRLTSIETIQVLDGVQNAHERPYHCQLAEYGQNLFSDTVAFTNDRKCE
jgi:hypothetical protein